MNAAEAHRLVEESETVAASMQVVNDCLSLLYAKIKKEAEAGRSSLTLTSNQDAR